MFEIVYAEGVAHDLGEIRAFDRSNVLDKIEEQLRHEPSRITRHKKPVVGLRPPWDHILPVWELRIGEYRVFYDVDDAANVVAVRAVRRKPPHQTTGEIV